MSMDNEEKPRIFVDSDGHHVINIVTRIRARADNLLDEIDRAVNDRTLHISDNRGQISKDMIEAGMNTFFSYDRNGMAKSLHLSTKDQRRVLIMIEEVLSGKREAVQFQLTRNCDAVKEVFSREVFKAL
jgi:hypothetical protein